MSTPDEDFKDLNDLIPLLTSQYRVKMYVAAAYFICYTKAKHVALSLNLTTKNKLLNKNTNSHAEVWNSLDNKFKNISRQNTNLKSLESIKDKSDKLKVRRKESHYDDEDSAVVFDQAVLKATQKDAEYLLKLLNMAEKTKSI